MKTYRYIITFLLVIGCINSMASQVPERINYQGQLRDQSGAPISNKTVNVKFSILKQDPNGALEYQETHSTLTDEVGVFGVIIGNGTIINSGQIENIEWDTAPYFLKVEVDLDDGNGFILINTNQLISVPYAIQSKNVTGVSLKTDSFVIIDPDGNTIVGTENNTGTSAEFNTLVGQGAGSSQMTGDQNTLVGHRAGQNLTTANHSVFLGTLAGNNNTTGSFNTFIGLSAGSSNISGGSNTLIGSNAGNDMTGSWNVALGTSAGYANNNGFGNVFLGTNSGFNNNGFKNVFIGYGAGQNELGNEKLVIANGPDPDDTVITGDFLPGNATVRGELMANEGIRFSDGSVQTTAWDNSSAGSVPTGGIIMWSGTTPPAGWALCDGQNGTPDLRGRFVVGHDPAKEDYDFPGNISQGGTNQGETGGLEMVILTVEQLPSHTHSNRVFDGFGTSESASNTYPAGKTFAASAFRSLRETTWDHENSNEIQPTGSNEAHENRPPYYVLAFIIKL